MENPAIARRIQRGGARVLRAAPLRLAPHHTEVYGGVLVSEGGSPVKPKGFLRADSERAA